MIEKMTGFEPQKFYIGLIDFFSILLPGALLTYLLMGEIGPKVLGERYANLAGAEATVVFLFASYLFGHLIFLLGSWLDEFYDWTRRYTLNRQIALLAHRGRLLPGIARVLIWLIFKNERNLAVNRAGKMKQEALGVVQASTAINTFQWCKALLNIKSPESLAVVQRFEADSKFFRCFAIVLLLLLGVWPLQRSWPLVDVPVVMVLLILALWRYMEQRHKATNQAYWSVITLTAHSGEIKINMSAPTAGDPTHTGGVVLRKYRGVVKYLLVEATNDPSQWVLPKGHVEEAENPRETAVREVLEETGVWACIVQDLQDVSYTVNGKSVNVRFYLMKAVGRGNQTDPFRQHVWLPLEEALLRVTHPESRDLLGLAGEMMTQ